MSRHILVVSLDSREQERLDAGELVLPEHIESHDHSVICPDGNGCSGWIECGDPHEVEGESAACGPYSCNCDDENARDCLSGDSPPPWYDEEEFEFHGVMHTWRSGFGWTVPYTGCIVNFGDYELPHGYEQLSLGEHKVDDDWDDEWCNLTLCEEEQPAA